LIESADLLKNFAPHQQACAGHRAIVAGHPQLTVYARMVRWETAKSRLRNSVDAQNKAGVFDGAAGIDQSRADCASLGPLYVLSHDR